MTAQSFLFKSSSQEAYNSSLESKSMTKFLLYIPLLVGLLMVPGLSWADFEAGLDAYERGDYDTALKEWRPLADQGDVKAQFNLGAMYQQGQGVPQDYAEAAKWYRLAADQGVAEAQYNLATKYYRGRGIPQDYVLAHMWANLASSQGDEGAVKKRDALAAVMTPQQIAEAQRLAREWKPKGK